ncbi:S1 family peptidase, partial [Brevundimonas denitrificans]|uniref:S1 family peptidase n=1 Tax=Brevundimonas denitrificans TaxID=1443434 RepID=UPI0024E0EBA5
MAFPKPPDWLVYSLVVSALVIWSLQLRENADAPPAPPAPDEIEGALLGPITPFDPAVTVNAPDIPFQPTSGTAFSISRDGLWVTARHVVEGCRRPAIMVGGGRAVAADVRLAPRADIAVLLTQGGADAVPVMAPHGLRAGQRGFHPGYPQARAGE